MEKMLGAEVANAIERITRLNGDASVIDEARRVFPAKPVIGAALDELSRLAREVAAPGIEVSVDLAELGGFNYESGVVFAAFAPGSPDALARGGRYDEVGRSFGRARPATGFTMDLRELAALAPPTAARRGILAPCVADRALEAEIARLRMAGEVVVADLPGHAQARVELGCDRIIEKQGDRWMVAPLKGD
jgi:ATP phosphoribosyltransferase regulatory subunit